MDILQVYLLFFWNTLLAFALVVPIISILVIVLHLTFSIVLTLICALITVTLCLGRCFPKLCQDRLQVYPLGWWWRHAIPLLSLTTLRHRCQCGLEVKPGCARLVWLLGHWHLWDLIISVGKLSKDGFQSVRLRLSHWLLLLLLLLLRWLRLLLTINDLQQRCNIRHWRYWLLRLWFYNHCWRVRRTKLVVLGSVELSFSALLIVSAQFYVSEIWLEITFVSSLGMPNVCSMTVSPE